MTPYETPTITELGTIADFTQQNGFAFDFDGRLFRGRSGGGGGGTPTS